MKKKVKKSKPPEKYSKEDKKTLAFLKTLGKKTKRKIPNKETKKAIEDARNGIGVKNIHLGSTFDSYLLEEEIPNRPTPEEIQKNYQEHLNTLPRKIKIPDVPANIIALKDYFESEFFDFIEIVEFGAKKHGHKSFLNSDNNSMKHKNNCDSMFHHLAEHTAGNYIDKETGKPHLLHIQCRAAMEHTRLSRGIQHKDDLLYPKEKVLFEEYQHDDDLSDWETGEFDD